MVSKRNEKWGRAEHSKNKQKIFPGHRIIIPTEENKNNFFFLLSLWEFHSRAAVQNLILRLWHTDNKPGRPVLVPPSCVCAPLMVVSPCWFFFQRKKKKVVVVVVFFFFFYCFILFYIFEFSGSTERAHTKWILSLSFRPISPVFVCVTCLSPPSLYLSTEVTASGGFRLLFIYFIFIFVTFLCLFVPSPILLAYIATHTHQPHGKKPKIAVYGLCPALSIHYLVIFSLEQTVCHCTSKRHTGQIHVDVK